MVLLGIRHESDDRAEAIDAEAGRGFIGGHDERDRQDPGQAHAQQQPRAQVEPIHVVNDARGPVPKEWTRGWIRSPAGTSPPGSRS